MMGDFKTCAKVNGIEIETDGDFIRILDVEFETDDPDIDIRKFQSLLTKVSKISRNKFRRDFMNLMQEEQ
jgi:hypothetical protein